MPTEFNLFSKNHFYMVVSQFFTKSGSNRDNLFKDTTTRLVVEILEFENSVNELNMKFQEITSFKEGEVDLALTLNAFIDTLNEFLDVVFYLRSVMISFHYQLTKNIWLRKEDKEKISQLRSFHLEHPINCILNEETINFSDSGLLDEFEIFLEMFKSDLIPDIKITLEAILNQATTLKIHKYRFSSEIEVLKKSNPNELLDLYEMLLVLTSNVCHLIYSELNNGNKPLLNYYLLEGIKRRNGVISTKYFYSNKKSINEIKAFEKYFSATLEQEVILK